MKLPEVIDAVLAASTFARQAEVKAWEQEMTPCEHTLCLEQSEAKQLESQSGCLGFNGDYSNRYQILPTALLATLRRTSGSVFNAVTLGVDVLSLVELEATAMASPISNLASIQSP